MSDTRVTTPPVDDIRVEVPDDITISPDRRQKRSWTQRPRRSVLLFAALFVAIEAVGAFWSIPAQATMLAWATFLSLNVAIFGYRTQRTAGVVMTALFTNRLVVLTLPAYGVSTATRVAMVAAISIVVAYISTWVLSVDVTSARSDEGFPLKKAVVSRSFTSALTILSGFPIGFALYEALRPEQFVTTPLFGLAALPWALAVGALGLGAFGEELTYRRLVAAMVQHTGQSQTPWISAALYGAASFASRDLAVIAIMTLTGAFFAWSCERTGSIKPVVAAHAVISILVFIVFPAT